MIKKKICFIAQFPPPIHGLSKAVGTLYNSELNREFDFEKVNISNNRNFLRNLLIIKRSNADLFYLTISQTKFGNLRDLVILKLLRIKHKKCLLHLHGGYYRRLVDNNLNKWQRKANYYAVSKVTGAIVLGNSLKSIFKGMLPDDKIFVVPNCVDDEYLMGDVDFEKKVATLNKRKIKHVLYLSNFIRSKGYLEVLKMAKLEKEHFEAKNEKNFHFDFAGEFFEKADRELFFGYIKTHGLDDYVTYHGIVSGDKKRELLKICDIFMLLTRYPKEGQPISILEAMGNGMVIITTDHAGIPDIVKDGVNGSVVYKDSKNWIKTISDYMLLVDFETVEKENRRWVCDKFCQKAYISNMKQTFDKSIYF